MRREKRARNTGSSSREGHHKPGPNPTLGLRGGRRGVLHPSKAARLEEGPESKLVLSLVARGPSLPARMAKAFPQLQRKLMGLSWPLSGEQRQSQCHLHSVHLPVLEPRCLLMAVSIWLM